MRTLNRPVVKDLNVTKNAAEIAELEQKLGLPASEPERNLSKSRARLDVLREMASHRPTAAAAVPPAPRSSP